MVIRFFTSCHGLSIAYPYVIVQALLKDEGIRYVERFRPRAVWIEPNVHKFFAEYNLPDYPSWFINEYAQTVKVLSKVFERLGVEEVFYTIPDVPCDYPGRESLYPFNVERTLHYIKLFKQKYVNDIPATPVAVVQGKKDVISTVINAYLKNKDLYDEFELIAVGPTCATRNAVKLAKLVLSFDRVTARPYHVFGPSLAAIKRVVGKVKMMYSFDNSSYYFHNGRKIKNRCERAQALKAYLQKLESLGVEVKA